MVIILNMVVVGGTPVGGISKMYKSLLSQLSSVTTSLSLQHQEQISLPQQSPQGGPGRGQHGLQQGQDEGRHQVRVQEAGEEEALAAGPEDSVPGQEEESLTPRPSSGSCPCSSEACPALAVSGSSETGAQASAQACTQTCLSVSCAI